MKPLLGAPFVARGLSDKADAESDVVFRNVVAASHHPRENVGL